MRPEHWLYTIPLRLRSLFRRDRADHDLDAELRDHIEQKTEEYVAKGLRPAEARRQALLEMGGIEKSKEACRDTRRVRWLQDFAQDLRFGIRMLRKSPGFTLVAVLTLALGIGANTAIFSVIDSVLLEPLPFKNAAQLVALRETESAPGDFPLDGADYRDWQAQNTTFSSMSVFQPPQGMNASGAGNPEVVSVRATQANFFATFGVEPLIGRTFAKGEDVAGKNRIAVLSYGFWNRHFAGDPDALGKPVELNDESFTVIGVMPPWFDYAAATDIWTPMDINSPLMSDRGSHWAGAIGRMKDGVSVAQARADLLAIAARINQEYRAANDRDIHSLVLPLKDYLVGGSQGLLLILFGAVALVLLVACANVANLILARSTGRVREMALRVALGAGPWRIARQLLTESVLLALAGAALGIIGATWGVATLNAAETSPIPRINPAQVNLTVLLFTVGISALVGILFGIVPALHASQLDLAEDLKAAAAAVVSATSRGRALRNALIVAEISISLALLVGAGLLLRSFARLRSANIGIEPHNVLTMRVNLPPARYQTIEDQSNFFDRLLARIDHIPGVTAESVSTVTALEGGWNGYVTVPANTNPKLASQLVESNYVTPQYFKTFGVPIVEGRGFTEQDMQRALATSERVDALERAEKKTIGNMEMPAGLSYPVIINEAMAKLFWPNLDPVGQSYTGLAGDRIQRVIVGVSGDETQQAIRNGAAPENYLPLPLVLSSQGVPRIPVIVSLKTEIAPAGALNEVRGAIFGLDNTLGVYHVRTMDDIIAENMQDETLQTLLLGAFAALALALAAIGLYGVMSYLVAQRTHEIGIRMALGAQHSDVLRMVVVQGGKLILIGVAIGTAGALGLTQLLSASLFGVTATDPATYIAVAALLTAVALTACYIPARRAMKVDPITALRHE